MKILILANNDMGLYKFRKELPERLIADGHEVYVSVPDGDFVNDIKKLGCKVATTYISRHGTNPAEDLKLMKKYRRYIKKVQPDVVFTYTIKPNVYGGMVCASLGVPYVPNITGLGTAIENKGILQIVTLNLYRYAMRKAQTVFFQNTANEEYFKSKKIAVGKHKMLPGSGVNLKYFTYAEPKTTEIGREEFLFVGRVMKDKGIEEFLEAARLVKGEYPYTNFVVVGDLDGEYKDTLNQAQMDGIINYASIQLDVRPYYEKCDAVVLPSYHEGMANVLLEASAVGRPVLASDIPGCRETYVEGITGIGFEPRSAKSLYQAIVRFIKISAEEKHRMGKRAREKVESEFDREIVIEKYIEEIQKVYEEGTRK